MPLVGKWDGMSRERQPPRRNFNRPAGIGTGCTTRDLKQRNRVIMSKRPEMIGSLFSYTTLHIQFNRDIEVL